MEKTVYATTRRAAGSSPRPFPKAMGRSSGSEILEELSAAIRPLLLTLDEFDREQPN